MTIKYGQYSRLYGNQSCIKFILWLNIFVNAVVDCYIKISLGKLLLNVSKNVRNLNSQVKADLYSGSPKRETIIRSPSLHRNESL